MNKAPVFDWKSTVSANGPRITEFDFPALMQQKPYDAKNLFGQFCNDFSSALETCKDKRFAVTGVASKIGRDIHGKPSIELSDRVGGQCYVLFVFESEEKYAAVSEGDVITCRGNYLGVTNDFGVVMKRSEVLK